MSKRSWIRNVFNRPVTRPIRKAPPRIRLGVEALEDRISPVGDLQFRAVGAGQLGGGGASVDVGVVRNDTTAVIGGAGTKVRAKDLVDVNSLARRDLSSNTISVAAGGFALAGSISVYSVGGDFGSTGTTIGGLEKGRTYFVIRTGANTVQFAATYNDANAGNEIDLEAGTSGTQRLADGSEGIANSARSNVAGNSPDGMVADATSSTPWSGISSGTTAAIDTGATIIATNTNYHFGVASGPQMAAYTPAARPSEVPSLTKEALAPIVAEALARWSTTGAAMTPPHFHIAIADPPDGSNGQPPLLGYTNVNTILIDITARGFGWFIDPTPGDDVEFGNQIDPSERLAIGASLAFGRMDLLTVVMYELGHVLGLEDLSSTESAHDLMATTLVPGELRLSRSLVSGQSIGRSPSQADKQILDTIFMAVSPAEPFAHDAGASRNATGASDGSLLKELDEEIVAERTPFGDGWSSARWRDGDGLDKNRP
jgi:hypothetical protein